MTLGQGQKMTLTFNTHTCSFFQLVSGSQAANVLKKSTVFTFSYRKAQDTKFDLGRKIGQGQPQGHHLEQTMMCWAVPNATYQVSWKSGLPGSGEEDF